MMRKLVIGPPARTIQFYDFINKKWLSWSYQSVQAKNMHVEHGWHSIVSFIRDIQATYAMDAYVDAQAQLCEYRGPLGGAIFARLQRNPPVRCRGSSCE